MKKFLISMVLIVCVCASMFMFTGCSSKNAMKQVIKSIQTIGVQTEGDKDEYTYETQDYYLIARGDDCIMYSAYADYDKDVQNGDDVVMSFEILMLTNGKQIFYFVSAMYTIDDYNVTVKSNFDYKNLPALNSITKDSINLVYVCEQEGFNAEAQKEQDKGYFAQAIQKFQTDFDNVVKEITKNKYSLNKIV